MDSLVVSKEAQENAMQTASTAAAQLQQAQAALDAAKLNLERTKVYSPVDGYVTNLNVYRGDYATAGAAKLAIVDSHSFWVYGYFEETKLPHVRVGDRAQIRLMSGGELTGHVESISRGIYDRDNPQSRELLADVNPTFNWVRLAQRVPVRVRIDEVPQGVMLAAGTTCTVVIAPSM
jgi:multidrug resistance efflux pump